MGSVPKKGAAFALAVAIATIVVATTTTMAVDLSDAEKAHAAGWVGKPADAMGSWVGEKPYYDRSSNSCVGGKVCGHYTQVVWSRTTQIGCARVTGCNINGRSSTLIACNYNPRGNINGERPY
uniref:SCP domain-containing protein n=1 Tax=Oryza barthii TaxID=65489 RepID=A0A0D3GP37_9ORYZ